MSTEKRGVKRAGAQKASRHSKKYLRKGIDVAVFEDVLHDKAEAQRVGADVENVADDEIFTVDREPDTAKPKPTKFTKRQKAALDKISKKSSEEALKLPVPKAPSKSSLVKLNRTKVSEPAKVLPKKKDNAFDLWNIDFVPSVNHSVKAAGEHYLRTVKGKFPQRPKSVGKTTSLLHAVEVADAGASYNPSTEDYQTYVADIAEDECKLIAEEERIDRGLKPQIESLVTQQDRDRELLEGLPNDPRYDDEGEEDNKEPEICSSADPTAQESSEAPKRTRKQKAEIAARLKLEERQLKQKKLYEKNQQEIFKAKQINKEITEEELEFNKKVEENRKQRMFDQMTKRQKLGRGKFTEQKEFLLTEELTGNLRQLKPQGNVLLDRVKSMQKRNILPIAGDKNKKKIKKSLKRKWVEKRSAREVTQGSRVI